MLHPDRMVVYARGHRAPDVHSRIYVPIFAQPEIARGWLDFFLDNETHRRENDTIFLDCGVTLRSEQLDRILAASPSAVSDIDQRRILRFKYGIWEERHDKPSPSIERAAKPEREARPACPPGYITITELCAGSSVLPTHARAALRAEGMIKPAYGWAFAPADIAKIKQICNIA